jgi:hypothetical protein
MTKPVIQRIGMASLALLLVSGCGEVDSAAQHEAELVEASITIESDKGQPLNLDSIALYTPAGEGVTSELPSGGSITTRVKPGTYKVVALPSTTSPGAEGQVPEDYRDPQKTPWEITVGPEGGAFELETR